LKHLAQACVLFQEALQGYPAHRWLAIGHMAEAEAESQGIAKGFSDLLREERKKAESVDDLAKGYVPDCVALINRFAGVSPEAKIAYEGGECPTCDKLKSLMKVRDAGLDIEDELDEPEQIQEVTIASDEELVNSILALVKELM